MQLALLSGASPLTCKDGPVVRLQAGTWEISVDGLKDSNLAICRNSIPASTHPVKHGHQFVELDPVEVQVRFMGARGTEKFITVNVKKVA